METPRLRELLHEINDWVFVIYHEKDTKKKDDAVANIEAVLTEILILNDLDVIENQVNKK